MSQERNPERQPEHAESGSVRWLFPEIEDEALEREHNDSIMERFRQRIRDEGGGDSSDDEEATPAGLEEPPAPPPAAPA